MTQSTSISAYHEALDTGLITALQAKVLNVIARSSKLDHTNSEIADTLDAQKSVISPRLRELELMGVVNKTTKRYCLITGLIVNAYTMTNRKPTRLSKSIKRCTHCNGTGRAQ